MNVTRATFDDVMVPNYNPAGMVPVRGEGSRVWDQQGNEFIDFAGGIAVNCLGHCHPALVNALKEQGEKIWHLSNIWTNEPALRLAKKMTDNTFADKVYFANSGAEANEAALKLARRWAIDVHGEHKSKIISFNKGFHGRTFFTVTVGGQAAYSDGFGPKPGDVVHCDYNDLESFKALIDDNTCAVMMEPLQGEGGIIAPDMDFVKGVRELCDKHNALLIFDEVQTGFGRTGANFAHQLFDVKPDLMGCGKAAGGGILPVSFVAGTDEVIGVLTPGSEGSTFGGYPLGAVVGVYAIKVLIEEKLAENAKIRGAQLMSHFENMKNEFPDKIKEVRGLGLLTAFEMYDDPKLDGHQISLELLKNGVYAKETHHSTVRIAPALTIETWQIDNIAEAIYNVVKSI